MVVLTVERLTKYLFIWIVSVTGFIIYINRDSQNPFFNLGPNSNLKIFYISIDNGYKYTLVACYTLVSTVIRTLQQEIVSPWIIQSIQNEKEKTESIRKIAYQVVIVDGIYKWFDWFMYMNILLTQIDMMLIEVVGNLVISYITTYYYVQPKKNNTIFGMQQSYDPLPLEERT